MRLLEDSGLIVRHEVPGDGRGVLYTINHRRHGAITAWLAGTEVGIAGANAVSEGITGPRDYARRIDRPERPFGDR